MRGNMLKGLVTGAIIGGTAATLFGIVNWQTERRWNRAAAGTGHWMADKTDELFGKK